MLHTEAAKIPLHLPHRRDVLKLCGSAALAGALGSGRNTAFAATGDEAKYPAPCAPKAWKKHGIVLEGNEPWERNEIQAFMSSVEPLENGRWRIWYGANDPHDGYIAIGIAEGVPGEKMTKTLAVLSEGEPEDAPLAIGNMPKGWRLAIPTHIHMKDGRHRLYFFVSGREHGRSAQRYLAADSDDGRRYRVVDPQRPCLYTVWDRTQSKKFQKGQKLEDILTNDGATVYQLPDGSFEMYAQSLEPLTEEDPRYVKHDNISNGFRVIDRLTSEDGLRFDKRERRVLAPDKNDPIDTQFYHLTVTHTPRGRVGMLGWYRVQDGFTELHYVFSKDGVHWDRVRHPWLERGKVGEPDSLAIYPPNSLVHHANKWWLFYTGVNYTHSTVQAANPEEKRGSVIMLATTPNIWAS